MRLTMLLLVALTLTVPVQAGNWPQFRGPNFNGSANEESLPSDWSTTENVAWKVDLPGPSAATPAIWGDHVFVSTTNTEKETLQAACFHRGTGKLLWQHTIASGLRRASRSNFASPSPATDGKVVIFFYGNGDLIAYDFDGKEQWKRNIQKDYGWFHFGWTFSTSPVLFNGKLYLQVLQRDVPVRENESDGKNHDSFILAMDPASGKELFRHVRPSKAKAESREAFTTPTPVSFSSGRQELLVVGGDAISGHDLETGAELWRWGTWNPTRIGHWRLVPSPVASEDVVLVCAPKREPIYAIKTGGKGTLTDNSIAWTSKGVSGVTSDVPTPAFYQNDFFVLYGTNRGRPALTRVDPKTGDVKWSTPVRRGSKYEASPLAGDGKIYLVNFEGTVTVVNAESGKILSEIAMDEDGTDLNRSTIVAASGRLFVRTNTQLYCIGK